MRRCWLAFCLVLLMSCDSTEVQNRAVYLLIDPSVTDESALLLSKQVVRFYLQALQPGDAFAIARIDGEQLLTQDVIAQVVFDQRPSYTNAQKRLMVAAYDDFLLNLEPAGFTNISGGIAEASVFLRATGAHQQHILLFSDLQERLPEERLPSEPFDLSGISVTALNVIQLQGEGFELVDYVASVALWRSRVEQGQGLWRMFNDVNRIETLLNHTER